MDEIIRVVLTILLMAPMAYTDIRGRYALQIVMIGVTCASFVFLVYDIISGNLHSMSLLETIGYVTGILVVVLMGVMGRMGYIGTADCVAAACIVLVNPQMGGFPIGIAAIMGGYILAVAYVVAYSIYRNVDDIAHSRPYSRGIIHTHIKRKGEKFCMSPRNSLNVGGFDGDRIVTKDGADLFTPEESHGMIVTKTVPMIAMMLAGFVACSVLVLTGQAGGLFEFLADVVPGINR